MKFKLIFALLAIVIFSSSAFATSFYFIEKIKDEFDGTTTTKGHIAMKTTFPFDPHAIDVSIIKVIKANVSKYSIFIIYENTDKRYLNVPKGESLTFLIDSNQKVILLGEGSEGHKYFEKFEGFSNRKVQFSELSTIPEEQKKYITNSIEELSYPISLEELQMLANAKELKFKIQGENSFVYSLDNDNIQDIKRFLKEYGEEIKDASASAKVQ